MTPEPVQDYTRIIPRYPKNTSRRPEAVILTHAGYSYNTVYCILSRLLIILVF